MKTSIISATVGAMLFSSAVSLAQSAAPKPRLTVLSIDAKGVNMDPMTMGNAVRVELEKLRLYQVTDKYDVIQFMEDHKMQVNNCFGKTCLTEVGTMMKSDKMFSGSIEHIGKTMTFTYRVLDVSSSNIEKTYVHEFLYLPGKSRTW